MSGIVSGSGNLQLVTMLLRAGLEIRLGNKRRISWAWTLTEWLSNSGGRASSYSEIRSQFEEMLKTA